MPLWVELLAMLVYGNVLVVAHELGHAAFARAGGYRVTSFGVGLGRPVLRVGLRGGVVFHLDRWLIGGACTAIPIRSSSARRVLYHGGGLVVQGVLAVVLALLPDSWLVDRVESFNLLVALTNALPWRFGTSASDGWYILDALTGSRRGGAVLPTRARLRRLAAREATIGSPVGTMYAAMCLAWLDVHCNKPRAANAFFEQDPPESAVEPWLDGLYHYVRSEWHRLQGRPLAAVQTARDTRLALGEDLVDEAAALIALAEARALVDAGSPDAAAKPLARLTGLSGPLGRQATAIALRTVLDGDPDE